MLHAFTPLKCWKNGAKAFLRVNRYSVVSTGRRMNKIIDIDQLYEVMRMITQESGEVLKKPWIILTIVSEGKVEKFPSFKLR